MLEIIGESPGAFARRFGGGERLFDDLIGGVDVLGEEVPGGFQGIADGVHVLDRLVARELGRRVEHRHVEREEIADGIEVFAPVEAAQDGFSAGAGEAGLGVGGELREVRDDRRDLGGGGMLFRVRGRHLAEVELVDDVLDVDQRVGLEDRERELVEAAIAFLFLRAVALGAVGAEEGADGGRGGILGEQRGGRRGSEDGEQGDAEQAAQEGKAGHTEHVRRGRGRGACRC